MLAELQHCLQSELIAFSAGERYQADNPGDLATVFVLPTQPNGHYTVNLPVSTGMAFPTAEMRSPQKCEVETIDLEQHSTAL